MDSPSKPLSSPIVFTSEPARTANAARPRTQSHSSQDSEYHNSSPLIPPRRPLYAQSNNSQSSVTSFSRPLNRQQQTSDGNATVRQRAASPTEWVPGHRARQRSQGFFDPTIGSAQTNNMAIGLSASQIAAQAAMHVQGNNINNINNAHNRKRSQTLPDPSAPAPSPSPSGPGASRLAPVHSTPYSNQQSLGPPTVRNYDGFLGGHSLAAASAANAAFPRSPGYAPQSSPQYAPPPPPPPPQPEHRPPPVPEKDGRLPAEKEKKEKSKMKLFSKPKNIGIYNSKDDKNKLGSMGALSSPRLGGFGSTTTVNKFANASTTSLVDPSITSSGSSFYSSANASTSTLVPADRERDREKHKHHFLSRQKNKLKDKDDLHLALSSASSTSRPTDPMGPQPLYNFAVPASPGHASTFAKSVSGLDLRHGGRALREKKKEDKIGSLPTASSTTLLEPPPRDASLPQNTTDWPASGYSSTTQFGPSTGGSTMTTQSVSDKTSGLSQAGMASLGTSFGVSGMQPDDAWPLLKAKLLNVFEGEDLRPPIEDFNSLVSVHLKRCIQRRAPTLIIEDLNELLTTGFLSLDQTLRGVPDDRLVTHLVAMWNLVFSFILPFLQAVFLPLDLEFKGRGAIMNPREAADFWGAAAPSEDASSERRLGEELDVRRIILLKFRDVVFMPRYEALMAVFTRLSLDSISAGVYASDPLLEPPSLGTRPGTASSLGGDKAFGSPSINPVNASYTSQGSTLLSSTTATDTSSPFSRSRATSNTSAGSFPSTLGSTTLHPTLSTTFENGGGPRLMDSAQVTEMVGRMLQCVSVVAGCQSGREDEKQVRMERLVKELKLNWLGRGRTGRNRRGFVGTRLPARPVGVGVEG